MRSFILLGLMLVGCDTGRVEIKSAKTCQNIEREFTVGVPFPWGELEEITTVNLPGGCTMTTTVHYVYIESDDNTASDGSGNLPLGFYERGCQWDGCEPFNIRQMPMSDHGISQP